jgi:hypothetical protein
VCIIIIGILFVAGFVPSSPEQRDMYIIMGIVFIIFGVYRIVMYRVKIKVYYEEEEDVEE